jgi:hypothetical protein
MRPGEAWHIDVRFPHEVHNRGPEDRVHLVLDLVDNQALRDLMSGARASGRGFLTSYYVRHSLPTWVRERLGTGN